MKNGRDGTRVHAISFGFGLRSNIDLSEWILGHKLTWRDSNLCSPNYLPYYDIPPPCSGICRSALPSSPIYCHVIPFNAVLHIVRAI